MKNITCTVSVYTSIFIISKYAARGLPHQENPSPSLPKSLSHNAYWIGFDEKFKEEFADMAFGCQKCVDEQLTIATAYGFD